MARYTSAVLSPDGVYRYELQRSWRSLDPQMNHVAWVLLNPSTADDTVDDPTVRRLLGFSQNFGFDGFLLVNLFAFRTPSPKVLLNAKRTGFDVVGPSNDDHILKVARQTSHVVLAWGATDVGHRGKEVVELIQGTGAMTYCLGLTNAGAPKHPLYLRADTKLELY